MGQSGLVFILPSSVDNINVINSIAHTILIWSKHLCTYSIYSKLMVSKCVLGLYLLKINRFKIGRRIRDWISGVQPAERNQSH